MIQSMKFGLEAMWRASLYFCHPRTLALSLLPFFGLTVLAWSLGYFFWDGAVAQLSEVLSEGTGLSSAWAWMEASGWGSLKQVTASLLVIFSVTPFLVLLSLLVVTAWMLPTLVAWVQRRRFADLPRRAGRLEPQAWWQVLAAVLTALSFLLVSSPLWLLPPLVMVLPPLIWGWLCARVVSLAVWAPYASREERRILWQRHQAVLLTMGWVCGGLATLPTLIWVSGTAWATAFAVLVPLAMGLYVAVFAWAGLWFAHYGLAVLSHLRQMNQSGAAGTATLPVSSSSEI